MNFYKITNQIENHNGLQYRDGLVYDTLPFQGFGNCLPGGMYYSREDILAFVNMGSWIRQVEVPGNAYSYLNPGSPVKWKANMLYMHPKKRLWSVETFAELVADGADPKADNSFALRIATALGYTDIVKFLLPITDPKANDCIALRRAFQYGYSDLVNLLIPHSDPEVVKTLNIKAKK
jgi:hypothetical protein